MKVVHFCSADMWEQGILAYRIHKGLLNQGVDSIFVTMLKTSGDPSVKVIIQDPVFNDKVKLVEKVPPTIPLSFTNILQNWRSQLDIKIMPCEGDVIFSLIDSPINLDQLEIIKQADIIHLHWIPGMLDFQLAPLIFLGKPVVISMYDMFWVTGGCHYPGNCSAYLAECFDCPKVPEESQKVVKKCYNLKQKTYDLLNIQFVAQSSYLKNKISETRLFDNIFLITPCTPYIYYPKINKKRARELIGVDSSANVMISVVPSIASDRKGILNFLDVVDNLINQNKVSNPYLILIGSDSHEIEKQLKIPLHVIPTLPNDEILYWYYRASDLFLSTSKEEYVSVFAIDAMATGLPIVGFEDTSISDFIVHKENGYIAKKGDMFDFINGIEFVFKNYNFIKNKQLTKLKNSFDIQTNSRMYLNLYKELLNKKNKINIDKYIKWGEALFLNNKKYIALEIFKRLLEIYPNNSYILNNIGVIYWEQHRYKKAIEYFKKAHKLNPNDEEIKQNYLMALEELEKN